MIDRTLVNEILSAAHLGAYVKSNIIDQGGIMLVGPPGQLKSSILIPISKLSGAQLLSDLTVMQAISLRGPILALQTQTLIFPEFSKLFARRSDTAANIEGFIMQLTGEGFRNFNWESPSATYPPCRALVLGAMTSDVYLKHWTEWQSSGFARRFLWFHYRLNFEGVTILKKAARNDRPLRITPRGGFLIPGEPIEQNISEGELQQLHNMLSEQQQSYQIGIGILRRIYSILKWRYPKKSKLPMEILSKFALGLRREGVVVTVED